MSIDAITNKIIEDARREADSVRRQAEEQIKQIESETDKNIERAVKEIFLKAGQEAGRQEQKGATSANLEYRKSVLSQKQAIISAVFDRVLEDIKGFGKQKYQLFVENLFMDCDGDEEVVIPLWEKRIDKVFIQKINKMLLKKGKKGALKFSEEKRDIPGGGFILKKGRIEKNNSFEIYLSSLRRDLESEISRILFG